MSLKQYSLVARSIMQEALQYRLNFIMWRIRTVLQLFTVYFLWMALLPKEQTLFNYSQSTMLTYVLLSALVGAIVFSTRTHMVAEEINNGDLSNHLLRPSNYFLFIAARDVGDKLMNIFFSIIELALLFFILQPPIFIQPHISLLFLTLVAVVLATGINFFISFMLSTVGFWSNETWAPRFIFFVLLQFFSGSFFPLDILPPTLYNIFQLTPFPYLLYFPIKIYLGQLPLIQILQGLFVSGIWITVMYLVTKVVWNIGIKGYTAQGR